MEDLRIVTNTKWTPWKLQLAIVAPDSSKFLTECVKASLQIRCPKACMKKSG